MGAHDKQNAALLNMGTNINRVTGSGGKSGAYEADTETMFMLKNTIDQRFYQIACLGEVDIGGGGTTCKYLSQMLNCRCIDMGTALLNMHSPFEVCGVFDLWATIKAYEALMMRKM